MAAEDDSIEQAVATRQERLRALKAALELLNTSDKDSTQALKRRTHQKSELTRINHQHLAMAAITLFTLFSFVGLFFFFFYLRREEIPTFKNLLLALVFVAFTFFLANKDEGLINRSVSVLKHSWDENAKQCCFHRFYKTNEGEKLVQWFMEMEKS